MGSISLTSPAFKDSERIPEKYTCDGLCTFSPELSWEGVPTQAVSLVVICEDRDAPLGTWVHWVLFNLPADAAGLKENIPEDGVFANGAKHGANSWRRTGYGGPCPMGGTHHYLFKLFALDIDLDLEAGASYDEVLRAMDGHVLGEGMLVGTYSRPI